MIFKFFSLLQTAQRPFSLAAACLNLISDCIPLFSHSLPPPSLQTLFASSSPSAKKQTPSHSELLGRQAQVSLACFIFRRSREH